MLGLLLKYTEITDTFLWFFNLDKTEDPTRPDAPNTRYFPDNGFCLIKFALLIYNV